MANFRIKIVAGNYRDIISIGAEVTVAAGKVDVVNAGDEFANAQGSLP